MAKVLARNGKILMRNGRATVRCPGAIATISLAARVHVRRSYNDILSFLRGRLFGIWKNPDYYGDDDPCASSSVPAQVLSLAGIRNAPCQYVEYDFEDPDHIPPAEYPSSLTAVSSAAYRGVNLRSSATTPGSVATLDETGSGETVQNSADAGSATECPDVSSSLSTSADGTFGMKNYLETRPGYDRTEMWAMGMLYASSVATANLMTCGCCNERTLSMGVSTSGSDSVCVHEATLSIQPPWTGQKLRGTLEVSGSFNASLAPGQSFYQTINAATAAIVVRWRG